MTDTLAAAPQAADGTRGSLGSGPRFVRGLGWTLIWLGALTLGFVAHQLWITTWLSQLNQGELDVEREAYFATAVISEVEYVPGSVGADPLETPQPGGVDVPAPGPGADGSPGTPESTDGATGTSDPERLVLKVESAPPEHESFALIRIPKIERLEEGWNVVEGVRRRDLKTGAGHMPWTPLPGQPGNAVISGHRTTYGAPFHELDQLVAGDRIEVDTALGTHVYEVRETQIVKPTDVWVTESRAGAWLTLTTCHPKFSARQRLVVFAELVEGPNAAVILAAT